MQGTMSSIARKKNHQFVSDGASRNHVQSAGIQVRVLGDTVVTEINHGDWIKISNVHLACT